MDPNEFRKTGHRVVDLLSEYLQHIEERRVFPDIEPRTLAELFAEPLPQAPSPAGHFPAANLSAQATGAESLGGRLAI